MSLIYYKDLDVKKLSFGKLITKKDQLQPYAFPLYDNEKFFKILLPTAEQKGIRTGIPTFNKIYPEADLHFIRYPLYTDNEETQKLRTKLEEVDEYLRSEEFRKKMFDKEYKKYRNYQAIVKFADNTHVDTEKYPPHPDYIKIQIKKNYETKEIKSVVFVEENGERRKVNDIEFLDDMRKYINRGGKITPQIDIIKLWVAPAKGEYGVKLGLVKTIAYPSENHFGSPLNNDDDDFPETSNKKQEIDEESDEQETKPVVKETKPVAKETKPVVAEVDSDDSDSDDSDDSGSESDSEPTPPPKAQAKPAKPSASASGRGKTKK